VTWVWVRTHAAALQSGWDDPLHQHDHIQLPPPSSPRAVPAALCYPAAVLCTASVGMLGVQNLPPPSVLPVLPCCQCTTPPIGQPAVVAACLLLLSPPLQVDYLVTCHWDAASDQLLLVAGNNQGAAAFFPLQEAAARQGQLPAGTNPVCAPAVVLQGCHDSVVRSVQCFSGAAAASCLLCLSAGEDARVGLWAMGPDPGASPATSGSLGSAGGPARQHASSKSQRRSPY
jgi:hypothetical protein